MKNITDTFNDKVKVVKETEEGIRLHFATQAAFYKIDKSNPKFKLLKQAVEKSVNKNKIIKVVVEIPSMEITSID